MFELASSRHDILSRAINAYGIDAQVDMMIEEMSELTKALLKARRAKRANDCIGYERMIGNIREEIADVQIMLDQMKMNYGDTSSHERRKIERLARRLEGTETT